MFRTLEISYPKLEILEVEPVEKSKYENNN